MVIMNKRLLVLILIAAGLLTACNDRTSNHPDDPRDPDGIEGVTEAVEVNDPEVTDIPPRLLKYPTIVPPELIDEDTLVVYDYSGGRDDNGHWAELTATEHVNLVTFNYNAFEIPFHVHNVDDWHIDMAIMEAFEDLSRLTNADVAKRYGESHGWNTIQQLRDGIRDELFRAEFDEYFTVYISENMDLVVPDSLMETIEGLMLTFHRHSAVEMGMPFDEYVSDFFGIQDGVRGLIEMSRAANERVARVMLVLQAISEDMELNVTEADVEAFFVDTPMYRVMSESERAALVEERGMPYFKQLAMMYKVTNHIIENAVYLEQEEH